MLISRKPITAITRNRLKLKLLIFKNKKIRPFSASVLRRVPTNNHGVRVIQSRKKVKLRVVWSIVKKPIQFRSPNLITKICFSFQMYKFISIITNSNGSVVSKLTTENHKLFSYLLFIHNKRLRNKFNKIDWKFFKYNSYLRFTKRRSFISCLELYFNNGVQYATSPGSKARLLERYNHIKCCTIQLPSKEVKLFSFNATCNSTPLLLKNRNKLLFDSKRYNRSKGFGPKVRGVAMNAIDHPHGGKTKSIKFPKTPWGLPTKLK